MPLTSWTTAFAAKWRMAAGTQLRCKRVRQRPVLKNVHPSRHSVIAAEVCNSVCRNTAVISGLSKSLSPQHFGRRRTYLTSVSDLPCRQKDSELQPGALPEGPVGGPSRTKCYVCFVRMSHLGDYPLSSLSSPLA